MKVTASQGGRVELVVSVVWWRWNCIVFLPLVILDSIRALIRSAILSLQVCRSEGFGRAAYFVPGRDGVGVGQDSRILPAPSLTNIR